MKYALIVANLAGFVSFLLNDIKLLKEKGYNVVFAANTKILQWEDTKKALEQLSVPVVHIDFDSKNPFSRKNFKAFIQIKTLLKKEKYDLIHCHTPIAGLITRLAAYKYRKKGAVVIYTTHGFAFTSYSSAKEWFLYYSLENFSSRFCDAIITINKEDYGYAKKMNCKQVFYINGVGVDISKYCKINIDREKYRESIGVKQNKIMVLSVGELSERKNHQIIIKALAKIEDRDKYVYVICGNGINGGTGDMLRQLAIENKVNLILLGFRHDIPEITKCSDIGAIPSVREGLGLSGIQFLAAGIPVIGTNVQGIRDYIIDGKTGFLCKAFDENMFANAIRNLSNLNAEDKEKFRQNCMQMAQKFDIKVSYSQMKQIYSKLGV